MTSPYDPAHAFPVNAEQTSPLEQKEGEEFADQFSRFCNDMRSAPKGFALDKLMREHRTIQQNIMRFAMAFIARMADQEHDLRNQASVELAKEIMERTDYESRALPKI